MCRPDYESDFGCVFCGCCTYSYRGNLYHSEIDGFFVLCLFS